MKAGLGADGRVVRSRRIITADLLVTLPIIMNFLAFLLVSKSHRVGSIDLYIKCIVEKCPRTVRAQGRAESALVLSSDDSHARDTYSPMVRLQRAWCVNRKTTFFFLVLMVL